MTTLIGSLRRIGRVGWLVWLSACFFSVLLIEAETAYAAPPQSSDDAPRGPSVKSGTPFSSTGTYLKIGISPAAHYGDYNLGYGFQYPIGFEHAAVEWWGEGFTFGYTVGGAPFYATSYESGGVQNLSLISATIISDTATEAIYEVVLRTTDNRVELVHRFHFLKDRKYVTLTTIIKNLSSEVLNGVRYRRIWDFDMDNTADSNDGFNIDMSRFMLYAWETHYAALAASLLNPPTEWDVYAWDDIDTYLPGSSIYNGPFPAYGDYNVRLEWVYETLSPGQSKQIVMYHMGGDSYAGLANSYDLAVAQAKQWTFMVYLDGDNNLEEFAVADLNEMEAAGSDANINIVVQLDRIPRYDSSNGDWTTCKRFYVTRDPGGYNSTIVSTELADLGECNMGDPNTLIDFVNWVKANYPAQHYALVLWDHGGGWKILQARLPKGVIFDDTDSDYITTPELRSAMQSIYSSYGTKIDIVGFDACLMGMAEIDYELAPYAQYRVGSEQTEPVEGWDYVASLGWLVSNPTATPQALASRIVSDYGAFYGPGQTQSAVDLNTIKTPTLASDLNTLATNLMSNMPNYRPGVEAARNNVKEYSDRDYIDLYHFAQLIYDNINDPTIRANAQAVMNAVSSGVVANHGGTNDHGISIYFPHNCSDYRPNYDTDVLLSVDTNWNDFLKTYCTVRPANDNFVDAQIISGYSGSVTGSNVGATKEPCEPNHYYNIPGGASVWYRWTAPASGNATFDTFGSDFDTILAVYTGDNLCNLAHVASNDDWGGGWQSQVIFYAVAGTTYHIAVDGYGGFGSSTVLNSPSTDKVSIASVAQGNIVLNWNSSMCTGVTVTSSPQRVSYRPTATRPSKKTITVRVTNRSGGTRVVTDIVPLPEEPFIITRIRPSLPKAIPDKRLQIFTIYTEVPAGSPPVTATKPYFLTILDCGAFTTASEPQSLVPLQVHDVQVESQGDQVHVEAAGTGIASVRLQLYDLTGRLMLDEESQGDTLTLPSKTAQGRALANGVYLYVVHVRGYNGREYVSEVRKLVILH